MAASAHPTASPLAPLAPFATRSFRFQWPADLCTAWALEMETLILGWFVLVESGSVLLLSLFGALMYVGTLLSPLMGTLGDRLGLRRVLTLMRLAYAALACIILWLAATGRLEPNAVLAVAFVAGLLKPTDIGMRTALVSASVPPQHLVAAMGISRTTQDSARICGALAGAGFMANLGLTSAYVAIIALYLVGAIMTARSGTPPTAATAATAATPASFTSFASFASLGNRATPNSAAAPAAPAAHPTAPASSSWRELLDGLQHVWQTPQLRAALLVAALANLCAFPLCGGLMPYIARDVFGLGQQGLGWLVASFACGALVGSLSLSTFGARLRPGRTLLVTMAVWFLCLLGLALPVNAAVAKLLYVASGFNQSLAMLSLSIILMRSSEARFRGRVMGARMLAIYTLPIGLMTAGALIPAIGFHAMVAAYVACGLLLTATIAWVWRSELWSVRARANVR